MIIKGKSVIGLNIVTIDTGAVVQTVDDIAYDPINHRIIALLVDSGGLFSSAKAIHMDDVRNIGEDAVIVHDASVIKSVKDLGDDVHSISDSNKHLVKTNILTIDGKELGKVTDIYFDSATGEVESMEVSQGGLKSMTEGKKSIKPSDIVTIGADATIVSAYTEMKLDAQGEEGGLKGAFNEARDKTAEIAEATKEKAIELKDAASDKFDNARETIDQKSAEARVKAVELRDDISKKADDFAVSAQAKADELKVRAAEKNDALSLRAQELADVAQEKGQELSEAAKDKAAETKDKVTELAETAKERVQNGKEKLDTEISDKRDTVHHKSDTVVKQSTEHYEDENKTVDTKKTIIEK